MPRDFFAYQASNALTKLGDALASPKAVLARVMAVVLLLVGGLTSLLSFLAPETLILGLFGSWVGRRGPGGDPARGRVRV